MASLRCHGDSDCNKTQIIRNFHLYIIQLWKPFFHIFTHGDVINAQTWEVSPPKKSSRATLKPLNSERNTYNRERIIYKNTHNRYYLVGPPPSTLLSVTCPSLHLWPADNTLAKKNYNCLLLSSDRYR